MKIVEEPFQFGGVDGYIEEYLWKWLNESFPIHTVFDIGASNSIFPNIFEKSSIYLFEPLPVFHEDLTSRYSDKPNVTVCPYGIGDQAGMISYYQNTQSFTRRTVHVKSCNPIDLPIYTFDDTVKKYNIDNIDFLKIDVEGLEFDILKNAQPYIRDKKIKFIQFEIGGTIFDTNHNLFDIFALFDSSWNIYNMQSQGVLNRMNTAFTWNKSERGNGNLLATWMPLN